MKLTRASSYAIHALVFMAAQKKNRPVASHHIAKARGIPERFLLKVLKPLVTARVLTSIKGPNGGYRLARPATDITMLEIVEAVEQAKIEGTAPPPESDPRKIKEDYPNYKPENSLPLFHKLENLCKQTADIVRKSLEKVRVSELLKK